MQCQERLLSTQSRNLMPPTGGGARNHLAKSCRQHRVVKSCKSRLRTPYGANFPRPLDVYLGEETLWKVRGGFQRCSSQALASWVLVSAWSFALSNRNVLSTRRLRTCGYFFLGAFGFRRSALGQSAAVL